MRQKVLKVSSNYNTYPTRFILYHLMGLDQARVSLKSLLTRPLQEYYIYKTQVETMVMDHIICCNGMG